jgi:hypothetical protein
MVKRKVMNTIKKFIDHNLGLSVAVTIGIIILIWCYGCQSKVKSIAEPTKLVTREELKIEVGSEMSLLQTKMNTLVALGEARVMELDRQDETKRKFAELGLAFVKEGKVNPIGIATILASLLGVGAAVDNRAKDKVIKTQKNNNGANKTNNG